jgi:hypothetical protein
MGALVVADLVSVEAEPRIADWLLGERLGFKRRDQINILISRNRDEIERFGGIFRQTDGKMQRGRGRPSETIMLNEPQALLLCMFARTASAAAVRRELIRVFMDYRRGILPHGGANPEGLTDSQLAEARVRVRILSAVQALEAGGMTRTGAIKAVADAEGVSTQTLWVWRRKVVHLPQERWLVALAPAYVGGGRPADIGDDIWEAFRTFYLALATPTISGAYAQVERLARQQGAELPHRKTFERRIRAEQLQALRVQTRALTHE